MAATPPARTARALCVALILLTPLGCTYTERVHVAYAIRYSDEFGPDARTHDCAAMCERHPRSQNVYWDCLGACDNVEAYDGARCDQDARRIINVTPSRWEPEQVSKLGTFDRCVDVVNREERIHPLADAAVRASIGLLVFLVVGIASYKG